MEVPAVSSVQRGLGGGLWAVVWGVIWTEVAVELRPAIAVIAALGLVIVFWPQVSHIFRAWRDRTNSFIAYLSAVLLAGALALVVWFFFVHEQQNYHLDFVICRGAEGYKTPKGLQLDKFDLWVGLWNPTKDTIYAKVVDSSLDLGGVAREGPIPDKVRPIQPRDGHNFITDSIPYRPNVPVRTMAGNLYYKIEYGRSEKADEKTDYIKAGMTTEFLDEQLHTGGGLEFDPGSSKHVINADCDIARNL